MTDNVLSRTSWVPWSYDLDGATITCEMNRMNWSDAAAFHVNFAEALSAIADHVAARWELSQLQEPGPDATSEARTEHKEATSRLFALAMKEQARFVTVLDQALVRQLFNTRIRRIEGLFVDGTGILTGEALLEVADRDLVQAVLLELRRLTNLSAKEGKAYGSPSTSDSAASGPSSSDSPAPSIVPEGSTPPSTATEIAPAPV